MRSFTMATREEIISYFLIRIDTFEKIAADTENGMKRFKDYIDYLKYNPAFYRLFKNWIERVEKKKKEISDQHIWAQKNLKILRSALAQFENCNPYEAIAVVAKHISNIKQELGLKKNIAEIFFFQPSALKERQETLIKLESIINHLLLQEEIIEQRMLYKIAPTT